MRLKHHLKKRFFFSLGKLPTLAKNYYSFIRTTFAIHCHEAAHKGLQEDRNTCGSFFHWYFEVTMSCWNAGPSVLERYTREVESY